MKQQPFSSCHIINNKTAINNETATTLPTMRFLTLPLLLLLFIPPSCLGWQFSRRQVLRDGTFLLTTTAGALVPPADHPAHAARGAAELDLEYYVRDLVGGNKKEGNIQASAPPITQPPRMLGELLIRLLWNTDNNNNNFTTDALPVAVLVDTVAQSSGKQQSRDSILQNIQTTATTIRDKASRSFYARAPWHTESVRDQYYFDLTTYALWRTAALLLPNYADRDVFVRNVGRALYQQLVVQQGLLLTAAPSSTGIVGTVDRVRHLLDVLVQNNFCTAYRLGPDDVVDEPVGGKDKKSKRNEPVVIVDELDDQALRAGGSVDFLVSVIEPATLGAALQITGEQSRFAPDLVGPTLAALWEDTAGLTSTWETFFIDPVYRPNPKDYFPTEQLYQFTLRSR